MLKKTLIIALLLAPFLWAQADTSAADRLARKKSDEDQRLDEYANSMKRRDWLKDRLILEPGFGTKYSIMGKTTFGFGAAVEYITSWHVAPFASYGLIFKKNDPAYDTLTLQGGSGYRVGLSYYLLPKSPLHVALSGSYGDVYFDHKAQQNSQNIREIVICKGWEGDMTISYLTNEWYFLNFIVGMYYVGDKMPGTQNISSAVNINGADIGLMLGNKRIPDKGLVFGIGIGFALPELFPDDTEIRRRQREDRRDSAH